MHDFELPEGCVILNKITIVEYIDDDSDEVEKFVLCEDSAGESMSLDRTLFLLEWAKAVELAPMTAQIIAEQICECEDDEDA